MIRLAYGQVGVIRLANEAWWVIRIAYEQARSLGWLILVKLMVGY